MARPLFLYQNFIDAATLTASSASSTLPVNNLKNAQKTKVWRTGSTIANEYVVIDFGAGMEISCVVILNHNFLPDEFVYIEGNATDSWGAPSFSQFFTWNLGPMVLFFAPQFFRYFRVRFTKTTAGTTRDIGRIFLGNSYGLTQNVSPDGLSLSLVDLSDTSKSSSGQSYSDIKSIHHEIDLNIKMMSNTQHELLKLIAKTVGTHTPFFISLDNDTRPSDWMFYVKFKRLQSYNINAVGSILYWDASLQLEEQL